MRYATVLFFATGLLGCRESPVPGSTERVLTPADSTSIVNMAPSGSRVLVPDLMERFKPKVYLTLHVHLEGKSAKEYAASPSGYNDKVRWFMDLLNEYHAKGTMESANGLGTLSDGSAAPVEYYLDGAHGGHGLGVHADGLAVMATGADYTAKLREQYDLIPTGVMRSSVRHVSGVCSQLGWVPMVHDEGFSFISSPVLYCSMCMSSAPSCTSGAASCHEPWSSRTVDLVHPWLTSTCADWTTHEPKGYLGIVPTIGPLKSLHEYNTTGKVTPGGDAFDSNDLDRYFDILESTLRHQVVLIPHRFGHFDVVDVGYSLGSTADEALMRDWLEKVETNYVSKGRAEWKTIGEVWDMYVAKGYPAPYPSH